MATVPPLVVPLNYEMVSAGVYRSGFPTRRNIEFLRRLRLRSIVRLSGKAYSPEVEEFIASSGITVVDCATEGNREPFSCIHERVVRRAIGALSDEGARPILVHCLNGQQTTGCIVGLLRRVENWALSAIFDEYRRHVAGGRVHALDLQMIELWQVEQLLGADDEEEEEVAGLEGSEDEARQLRAHDGAAGEFAEMGDMLEEQVVSGILPLVAGARTSSFVSAVGTSVRGDGDDSADPGGLATAMGVGAYDDSVDGRHQLLDD